MRLFVSVSALFLLMLYLPVCLAAKAIGVPVSTTQSQIISEKYQFVVLQNDTGGWYYTIKEGTKSIIVQKSIPAIQGNKAFSDSVQTAKVAMLMTNKMNKGIFPPTVQKADLDSLNIKF